MKRLSYSFFLLFMSVIVIHAQEAPTGIGLNVKALLFDYQSQNGGDITAFQKYHHGFEIGLIKHISNQLYFSLPIKLGAVQHEDDIDGLKKSLFGADAQLHYQLLKPNAPIIPHLLAGAGYVYEKDGISNIQIPVGFGLNFKLAKRAFLTWQSEFRFSLEDQRNNLHHGLGLTYYLGPPEEKKEMEKDDVAPPTDDKSKLDSDSDGIIDELDLCPQEAGPKELDGCPDRDKDGIADYKDQCPDEFGAVALRGCPDTDGDGVSDYEDECPKMPGSISNNGCPDDDADQDGIPNDLDRCPTVAGPATNSGCPELDGDGDGVPDNIDKCPSAPGPKNTLGCPDQDLDGVPDSEDRCPSTPGSVLNNGCPDRSPDRDGDGVPDNIDRCPDIKGSSIYSGCPDTDGDGVEDPQDNCPNIPGPRSNNGCPTTSSTTPTTTPGVDTDGDGVLDAQDKCPTAPGLSVYDGCPDTDGDGIDDSRDRCPNTPGPVYTQGCPEVAASDQRVLEIAMRSVQYESAKVEIKSESFNILRQIAEIMSRYPDFNLSIEGHTDSRGDAIENQILSEKRAKACYDFLINSGVNANRMSYAGYGEARPVATNETISGRTLNRRVEFALIPRN